MTHTGTPTKYAARLRMSFTGESYKLARDEIISLDADRDLRMLGRYRHLLRRLVDVRISDHNVAEPFRRLVIPDAACWQQRLLETYWLLGLKRAHSLEPYSLSAERDSLQAMVSVTPRPDVLIIRTRPEFKLGILMGLVCRADDGGDLWDGDGLPCVRFERLNGHVRIWLADTDGETRKGALVIPDVPAKDWGKLVRRINNLRSQHLLWSDPLASCAADTRPRERVALEQIRHMQFPFVLASRLARRLGLFTSSWAIDAWIPMVSTELHFEYQLPSGPSVPDVRRALSHPLGGLVSASIGRVPSPLPSLDRSIRIYEHNEPESFSSSQSRCRGDQPALVIRPLQIFDGRVPSIQPTVSQ